MSLDSLLLLNLLRLTLHPEGRLSSLIRDLRRLGILEFRIVDLVKRGGEFEGLFIVDLGLGGRRSVGLALELGAVAQDVLSRWAGGVLLRARCRKSL